jgi:hypothetical protein
MFAREEHGTLQPSTISENTSTVVTAGDRAAPESRSSTRDEPTRAPAKIGVVASDKVHEADVSAGSLYYA